MKISILGASGAVGAPAAFFIAAQQLADDIVMIGGQRQNLLQQHVMDIGTAVSAQDVLVRTGTYADMHGSRIVINAAGVHQDGASGRAAMLSQNIPLIREIAGQIRRYCPQAIVITATNPVEPLNYATYLAGGLDRSQAIGYSINDSFRFRQMVAQVLRVKVSQVDGTVIGEHGPTQVPLFSSVRIDGRPMTVSEEIKQHIRSMAPTVIQQFQAFQAGRTAGWTCAVGLAAFVRAIGNNSGATLPCSLVLTGEYGQRGLSMTVPARIGRQGIQEILEWPLAADEQEGLERSAAKLAAEIEIVEAGLK